MIAVKAVPAGYYDGINENASQNLLNIFPNPSSGLFTLFSPQLATSNSKVLLDIYDFRGQKVTHKFETVEEGKILLNLEFLEDGIYLVRIPYENSNIQGKLIKNQLLKRISP